MTPDEQNRLHETSLKILAEIGVRLEHDEIVRRMIDAGARPGAGPQDVRIPREMVREYLARVPSAIKLDARDSSGKTLTPNSPSSFWTNPAMYMWTGTERRKATSEDLACVARLCDHLENVHGVMGMALDDLPPRHRDFVGLRVIAENCRKHIRVLCFTPDGMDALVAMKPVFPGNWFSVGFTAHGPLRWTNLALEIFRRSAGHGIPATINGEPMAGVSGPVTIAGAAAVGNAEILVGIVVNQLLEPGRPMIYNLGLAHVFDMKAATAVTGGPENALFAQISAEMGQFYNIPSSSWVSTESCFTDQQAGLEKMFGFHTHSSNGVSLVWGMGQLESKLTMSLGQLVVDNEMINYARRYQCGCTVNEDTLAYNLVREVGIAGSFLETDHTLLNFREQLFDPRILNRKVREATSKSLDNVASQLADEIITADTEAKISSAESTELRRVEKQFRSKTS
ncbi:MAG: trimethylamine methyltransferase family protein [Verrucomicrobiota bacterium]